MYWPRFFKEGSFIVWEDNYSIAQMHRNLIVPIRIALKKAMSNAIITVLAGVCWTALCKLSSIAVTISWFWYEWRSESYESMSLWNAFALNRLEIDSWIFYEVDSILGIHRHFHPEFWPWYYFEPFYQVSLEAIVEVSIQCSVSLLTKKWNFFLLPWRMLL